MLNIAKERDRDGKYIKIDSGKLPFENNFFDLVLVSFVLLEIDSQEKIIKIVEEINRVLKVGGIFVAINASDNTYSHNWLTLNTDFPENKNINSGLRVKIEFKNFDLTIYDYFWKINDYINMFSKAGLHVEKIHQPLGIDDDDYYWLDEKQFSPCSVIICQKK